MAKKKIDIKKIKERNVSQKEIEENEKETKMKNWLLYRIPIATTVILALIYIPTNNNILLIPIALIFIVVLYGIDCHQRICEHCKKDLYTINFGAKEGKKLIDIIKPYMCPAMMYKVIYDVEELKKYYDVQEVSEILTKCTLESDRLLMEARNNSEKN